MEQIRQELESTVVKDKKKLSIDELLQSTSNDDSDDDSSDEELSSPAKKSPQTQSVEDLLDGYDDDEAEAATAASASKEVDEAVFSQVQSPPEDVVSTEKVPIQLSQRQRELLAKQDIPELTRLLESVDIEPLSEEEDLRDSCCVLIKKLRKVEQRNAVYAVTGTPTVETVNPEADFFEAIQLMDLPKLRKLHDILADVSILGRVSTAQERMLMVERYNPSDKTKLERIREEFLANATRTSYDDCVTQADFESVYQSRQVALRMLWQTFDFNKLCVFIIGKSF